MHDGEIGAAHDFSKSVGDRHGSGQIGVVELIGIANELVWKKLDVGPTERMSGAGSEVRKRHLELATHNGIEAMNCTGESVRGVPLGEGGGVEKGSIHPLRWGGENAVKSNGVGRIHIQL